MANRWYPHLDYAGEPMPRGIFRDPQPADPYEQNLRNAAILCIEKFCAHLDESVPPLAEEIKEGHQPDLLRCDFVGSIDGRRFFIGYEWRPTR